MQQYYVFFRCWPGFREPFPFQRFNSLSDEELGPEFDKYITEEVQKPEVRKQIRKTFRQQRDEIITFFTESVEPPFPNVSRRWRKEVLKRKRKLPRIVRLGSYLGWWSHTGHDAPSWGCRVWFCHTHSQQFAEQLCLLLNEKRKPESDLDPRFGFIDLGTVSSKTDRALILSDVGAASLDQTPRDISALEIPIRAHALCEARRLEAAWLDACHPPQGDPSTPAAEPTNPQLPASFREEYGPKTDGNVADTGNRQLAVNGRGKSMSIELDDLNRVLAAVKENDVLRKAILVIGENDAIECAGKLEGKDIARKLGVRMSGTFRGHLGKLRKLGICKAGGRGYEFHRLGKEVYRILKEELRSS